MATTANTVQTILQQIAQAVEPLQRELEPGRARGFFLELGIPLTPAQEAAIASPLSAAVGDARDMMQLSGELTVAIDADNTGAIIAKSAGLIQKIVGVIQEITTLK